jgi:hypothetical protein
MQRVIKEVDHRVTVMTGAGHIVLFLKKCKDLFESRNSLDIGDSGLGDGKGFI